MDIHIRFDEEASREFAERRWFALNHAADRLQKECEGLVQVLQTTQEAWHGARVRLSELQAVRDALGEDLAEHDACGPAQSERCAAAA